MATERGTLGFGQRLLLFAAWLVSCGFVFVLGVFVGKSMRSGGGEITPRVALPVEAAVPAPPPADAQAPLTFYDVLGSREGNAPATPRAAAPPPSEAAVPQGGALNERKLPPASAPPAVVPAPAPPPPSEVATHAPAPTAASDVPVVAPAVPGTAPQTERPVAAQMPAAKPAAPAPPAVATAPGAPPAALSPQARDGRWTVYANPTRDQLAVAHERAALRAKGYAAEVVTLRRDGDTWYRIRVGRYATEGQAQEAARRLRSDGVGHAFVQSE